MAFGEAASRLPGASGAAALLASLASAFVLTGAAFVTVAQVPCDDPGMFLRSADGVHLVGGCVEAEELPAPAPTPQDGDEQPESEPPTLGD